MEVQNHPYSWISKLYLRDYSYGQLTGGQPATTTDDQFIRRQKCIFLILYMYTSSKHLYASRCINMALYIDA